MQNGAPMQKFLPMALVVFLAFTFPAHAKKEEGLPAFRKVLEKQAAHLARLPIDKGSRGCGERYERLWRDQALEIDWFYGYLDSNEIVMDRMVRDETIRALRLKCGRGPIGACGFKKVADHSKSMGPILLTKDLPAGHQVRIRIWNSTLNDWNYENTLGVGRLILTRKAQKEKNQAVWDAFLRSLRQTEVVIYDGHSRGGSGPGFGPYGVSQMVSGQLLKSNWRRVVRALEKSSQRPEVIMFASCKSQDYYLPALRKKFPGMAVAATEFEQSFGNNEQTVFSLVDSLVVGRCQAGINEAMRASHADRTASMEVFNFESRR